MQGCGAGGDGGELWVSKRQVFRAGDPRWNSFIEFAGLAHLREVRTMDSSINPCLDGDYPFSTLDELWEQEKEGLILSPASNEYYLVFTDASGSNGSISHPRLALLGYDLSDETWTSSLLNCRRWEGALEPIAGRALGNGLLSLEDAKIAQAILPEEWDGDPHSHVTIWALFEVLIPEEYAVES